MPGTGENPMLIEFNNKSPLPDWPMITHATRPNQSIVAALPAAGSSALHERVTVHYY
jgi:hypothetical protein